MRVGRKWKYVQKRFYTETEEELVSKWIFENERLYETHYVNNEISVQTFMKYVPNYISKKGNLNQFACDHCTKTKYLKTAFISAVSKVHICGTIKCPYYDEKYGDRCECSRCRKCSIFKFLSIPKHELVSQLCCNKNNRVPKLACVMGKCLDNYCGVKWMWKCVLTGYQCHSYEHNVDLEVQYIEIKEHVIDGKKYKLIGSNRCSWKDFKDIFLEDIKVSLLHQYSVRHQNKQRRWISSVINDSIQLPFDASFTGIDYIANKKITANVVSQGVGTKVAKYSMLVTYNVSRSATGLKREGIFYLSDKLEHAWYSIIPALKRHVGHFKQRFSQQNHALKVVILFADRCGNDVWCSPCFGYLCELADLYNVVFLINTTASGHGKWHYDRTGGNGTSFIRRALHNGKIKFFGDRTISSALCDFLNENFEWTKKGDFHRQHEELKEEEITKHVSPVDTIEIDGDEGGITTYHCALIRPRNNITLRKNSCFCSQCLNSGFTVNCGKQEYCGVWRKGHLNKYPKYQDAGTEPPAPKKRKISSTMRKPKPPSSDSSNSGGRRG